MDLNEEREASAREADAVRVNGLVEKLNREMMRLPIAERRRRWTEYLVLLDGLLK